MSFRRIASALAAMVLVGGTLVAGAGSVSANKVWHQSIGKASAAAPCPTSTGAELAAGWTQWTPSWAQWPNQGTGGFVCNREITWAITPPAGVGCVFVDGGYLRFGSSNVIAPGTPAVFFNSTCSGDGITTFVQYVYALSNEEATALCAPLGARASATNPNVYQCEAY